MTHQVKRYHDICAGHRVVGHESKCRHLHGHNYRVHFVCETDPWKCCELDSTEEIPGVGISHNQRGELDSVGRVIDFSVVKEKLCNWLEENWDHKFLHWEHDPLIGSLIDVTKRDAEEWPDNPSVAKEDQDHFFGSLVPLPFNPTAENLAQYLVEHIGPQQLEGTGVRLVEVTIEETAKCHVTYKWD